MDTLIIAFGLICLPLMLLVISSKASSRIQAAQQHAELMNSLQLLHKDVAEFTKQMNIIFGDEK